MAILNGNSFTLTVSDSSSGSKIAFAHSQQASISFSNSLVEATLGVTNGWAEFLPGKKSSTVTFSGLMDYGTITNRYNTDDLADFLLDEDVLYFSIGDGDDVDFGSGYISEITLEGGTDSVASYSGILNVIGELSKEAEVQLQNLQDSDGNDILGDDGLPLQGYI